MLLIDLPTKAILPKTATADFSVFLLFRPSGSNNCTRHLFIELFKSTFFRLQNRRSFRSTQYGLFLLFIVIKVYDFLSNAEEFIFKEELNFSEANDLLSYTPVLEKYF